MPRDDRPANAPGKETPALPGVLEELRSAVADALDSSVPAGSGARSVGRSLGLTKTMGWKLWTIATCDDHERVIHAIPGDRGWRTMMAAIEAGCPSRSKVDRVRGAMEAFRRAAAGNGPGTAPRPARDPAANVGTTRVHASYDVILAPRDGRAMLVALRAEFAVIDVVLGRDDRAPRAELRVPPAAAGRSGHWEQWSPLPQAIEPVARRGHADPDFVRDGTPPAVHDLLLREAMRQASIDTQASQVLRYQVSKAPPGALLVLREAAQAT